MRERGEHRDKMNKEELCRIVNLTLEVKLWATPGIVNETLEVKFWTASEKTKEECKVADTRLKEKCEAVDVKIKETSAGTVNNMLKEQLCRIMD